MFLKNTKKYITVCSLVASFAIAFAGSLLFYATAEAANVPTLQLFAYGLSQVQVSVLAGDPNAPVVLYYSEGQSIGSANLGTTNSGGNFSTILNTNTYDLSGGLFYVTVDGARSLEVYYPSSAAPGGLSLSATQTSLAVGQSATYTASSSNTVVVAGNSNPAVASVSLGGGNINVTGNSSGTTVINLCVSNIDCATLTVSVGQGSYSGSSVSTISSSPTSPQQCVNLSANLYQGLNDSGISGQVTMLQHFLAAEGYLTATPNGHFGPSTFSAVKKFQSVQGISAIGEVGPATRAAIERISCAATTAPVYTPSATNAVPVVSPASLISALLPTSSGVPISGSVMVTSIPTGSTIVEGKSLTLEWNSQSGVNYNILLEDQYGVGQGYIASYVQGGQYTWTTGNVSVSGSGNQTISPGVYRIHVENATTGVAATDPISGTFTINPIPLNIADIIPTSAPADAKTTVILYGSGFNTSSRINVDTLYSITSPAYVSPDGTALAFTIPTSVSAGEHSISVANTYSISTTTATALSNAVNIAITTPPNPSQ